MANALDRLVAYSTAPATYDPPSPAECAAAAAEIKRLREALLSAMDFVNDAANVTPKVLTYRFHEFRPSDRKALKQVIASGDEGHKQFVAALRVYLQKWAEADWLTEYDLERIGQWTAKHYPDLARQVADMAGRQRSQAEGEQARKTYAVMQKAVSTGPNRGGRSEWQT